MYDRKHAHASAAAASFKSALRQLRTPECLGASIASNYLITLTIGARIPLRLYHRKFAVDGFEVLFQLAIDYLQSSNAESQSCDDSFLREPLTMLRNLAGNSWRGGSRLHDFAPQGFSSVQPCRRDAGLRRDAAEVDFDFLRLHLSDRCSGARHRSIAARLSTALQTCQVPNHDESPVL
jgi:hypothetical protein